MLTKIWLIPMLPLLGAAVNGLLGPKLSKRAVGAIACGVVLLAFLLSAAAVFELSGLPSEERHVTTSLGTWLPLGEVGAKDLEVSWGFSLDPLSSVMILIVTGVGFLIHVYATGYMAHEEGFWRFFTYLNLFLAMMLTLVLGSSLLVMFVGWEGVGLCSYLLIGFFYDRPFDERTGMSCADAGRKAFVVNRIGDFAFLIGVLYLATTFGTLEFRPITEAIVAGGGSHALLVGVGLLLFLGACGKSAQIPLYVWLPDAMAGPTPVSALIHAATMVTAGVYVTCRMAPLYVQAPAAMVVVAVVGALTALFAAVIGTAQDDIKKVLAYSTVSQLGYMMLAAGVGAFSASIFHLMTHAFFKALLFLGAGSVIHAMSGEQNVKMMGGLRRHLPITHATFLIAVLAIAGIPPFSGFFSKDEILAGVLNLAGATYTPALLGLWAIGVLTAGLTSFYMARLYLLVFAGEPRMNEATKGHLHESPALMTLPLVVLAAGATFAGFLGIPEFLSGGRIPNLLEEYLAATVHSFHSDSGVVYLSAGAALAIPLLASLAGIATAWAVYGRRPLPARAAAAEPAGLVRVVKDKFYVDETIDAVVVRPYYRLCRLAAAIDEKVVDGLVNAAAATTDLFSQMIRLLQTGYVRNYALVFFLATILILIYAMR